MAYEIDYKKYPECDPLKDFESWMSEKQLEAAKELANVPDLKFAQFSFACSIAGVSGKPVVVAWDTYRMIPDLHVQDYVEYLHTLKK